MSRDLWTADNPQPGVLDDVLAKIDEEYVERHAGDPSATLRILVSVEGEDAPRLERMTEASGKPPRDVVAKLLRDAESPDA